MVGEKGVSIKAYDDLKPLKLGVVLALKIIAQFDSDDGLQKDVGVDMETALRPHIFDGGLGFLRHWRSLPPDRAERPSTRRRRLRNEQFR